MPTDESVELRCSAYRCDNVVSVTDVNMSDPLWRRYHVHCPKHQLVKSRAQRKAVEAMNDEELLTRIAKLEREMEADHPNGEEDEEMHTVLHAMIVAARQGLSESPTALQAAWVLRNFADAEARMCTFSRKVEIMYPDDGGALMALLQAGGQEISNEMFAAEEYRDALRKIRRMCMDGPASEDTLTTMYRLAGEVLDA